MKKTGFLLCTVMLLWTLSIYAQQQDRLLQTLKSELDYSFNELKKKDLPPYYINLRASDSYNATISSSFGVMRSSDEKRTRLLVPQIRLGSPELDNFKYNPMGAAVDRRTGAILGGSYLPLDDNAADAIRQAIWVDVLNRYDFACFMYEKTKTQAAVSVEDEDKAPCFSQSPVEKYYEEPIPAASASIDMAAWEKRLNEISAAFKANPNLEEGEAILIFNTLRTYFVNTEGSEIVQNRVTARLMLSASLKAEDGMNLSLTHDFFAYHPNDLPDNSVIIAAAKDMLQRLEKLEKAPVADPYTGPAILSGPASGVFFHEIFGHRLEGHRLKTGGQTFKKMVGEQVLPESFQVYSDPTLSNYAGTDLNGHYLYDDEGVKARRVNNVVNGVLTEFLMNRVPLDGFPASNGHGRTSNTGDPVSRQSNLIIETTQPRSEADLRKMLIEEAKEQGKEYGYYFKTVTSGFTYTGEGGSLNSFNVTPLEVYRVFVDGRPDQLVRGVDMIGTPLSMFSNIEAAGDKPSVFTGMCGAESGWVPVTTCSPTIYVNKIETQRRHQSRNLPPVLPAPEFVEKNGMDVDETIFAALKDEMDRNQKNLKLPDNKAPFYFSYIVNRYRSLNVSASLGGVLSAEYTPWKMNMAAQVMVGDYQRNDDVEYRGNAAAGKVPASGEYNLLRRSFWNSTDIMYRYALRSMTQKESYLESNPLSAEDAALADMQPVDAVEYIGNRNQPYEVNLPELEKMAADLSALFKNYPDLYNTVAVFTGKVVDIYRLTSEGVKLKFPKNTVTFSVQAQVRAADGSVITDSYNISAENPAGLPNYEELKQSVIKFAEEMLAKKERMSIEEYYSGPVLFEGEATTSLFGNNLFKRGYLYANRFLVNNPKRNVWGDRLNTRVIDPRLSIVNHTDWKEYEGKKLSGAYEVDAEGVIPEKETILIKNGELKNVLNGRIPARNALKSTGSMLFSNNSGDLLPQLGTGVVHITTSQGFKADKLRKVLLSAGKAKGLKYVYIVRRIAGANTALYKVDVKTGDETPMRVMSFKLPGIDKLEKLGGISAEEIVSKYSANGYSFSVIHPASVLVNDVEITKEAAKAVKEPALKYPLQR